MKYFAVLLLAAVVSADTWTVKNFTDLQAARKLCYAESNLPASAINDFRVGKFENTAPIRAYVLCIFKQFELFCENEGFHLDRVVAQVQSTDPASNLDFKSMIEKCIAKTDADTTSDAWVYRAFTCFNADRMSIVNTKPQ